MATITDDLAKAVTEGFRQAQIDVVNQDLILSGTGDVTVTLADGSKKTGPSWTKLIAAATAAGTSAAAAATSATNAKNSETNANSSKTAAASSATAADTSKTNAKTSETNAKTSETNAKTSETNAKTSETNAAASLAAAQLLTSVPYEAAPYPDVWAPLSDDLRLLAGSAPYDTLTISGQVLELPTKSMNFTRSTTATYIDKSGVLQTAAINEPRFERDGLLIEGQSTNLYTYSEQWGVGSRVTTTNNSGDSPRGDRTMALVVEDTAATEHYTQDRNIVLTAGVTYCYSVFVKAHTSPRNLYLRVASGSTAQSFFDPAAGAWSGSSGGADFVNRGFENIGNGIYRVWMTFTAAASQSTVIRLQLANGVTANYTGDGVSGLYVWGAQFEALPNATSYIPTTTTAVTRGNEQLQLTPTGNIGYRTVGDIFARTIALELTVDKFVQPTTGVAYVDFLANMGARNDIIIRGVSNQLISYRGSGGIAIPNVTYPFNKKIYAQTIDVANNNTVTGYFDGKVATRNANVPTGPTSAGTSIIFNGNSFAVYHIRNFRIWHRVLTPNQINGLR